MDTGHFFTRKGLSRILVLALFLMLGTTSCNQGNYVTVKHVKPVNRNRYYKPGKDKGKKRVKYVKMKILKKSPQTASAPDPKKKKSKNQMAPPSKKDTVQYESDTTGFTP